MLAPLLLSEILNLSRHGPDPAVAIILLIFRSKWFNLKSVPSKRAGLVLEFLSSSESSKSDSPEEDSKVTTTGGGIGVEKECNSFVEFCELKDSILRILAGG
ncbi:unnamed protein product [Allacma fusca]|uniref:Uncharacterized protein n=1 Tax=Allacma fusca TaxID=39272 RepID=A0A8J2LCP9_9HEXA|nr:unnamed protein product [Allacma fusca]